MKKSCFILILLGLLPSSLSAQKRIALYGELGGSYAGMSRSLVYASTSPSYREAYKTPPIQFSLSSKPGYTASIRLLVNRDTSQRIGLYSGITWNTLRSSFQIRDIPDTFEQDGEETVRLHQHSIRFNLGLRWSPLQSKALAFCLGGTLDYNTYPRFLTQKEIWVNNYVLRQALFGLNLAAEVLVPRTKGRLMLRYSIDHVFGTQFSSYIKHQFNWPIEYMISPRYSYHNLSLSIRLY